MHRTASSPEACPVSISFDYSGEEALILNGHRVPEASENASALSRFQLALPLRGQRSAAPGIQVNRLTPSLYVIYDRRSGQTERYFVELGSVLTFAFDYSNQYFKHAHSKSRNPKRERERYEALPFACTYRISPFEVTPNEWDRLLGELE